MRNTSMALCGLLIVVCCFAAGCITSLDRLNESEGMGDIENESSPIQEMDIHINSYRDIPEDKIILELMQMKEEENMVRDEGLGIEYPLFFNGVKLDFKNIGIIVNESFQYHPSDIIHVTDTNGTVGESKVVRVLDAMMNETRIYIGDREIANDNHRPGYYPITSDTNLLKVSIPAGWSIKQTLTAYRNMGGILEAFPYYPYDEIVTIDGSI